MKKIQTVHNMKTNIVAQNGNINFGSTVQNSHTSNLKIAAACFAFGDFSQVNELQKQTTVIDINKEQDEIVE